MAAKNAVKARQFAQAGDLMTMLGVGKTRLVQLRKEPDWPEPIETASGGAIYRIADIEAWAAQRGRTLHPLGE